MYVVFDEFMEMWHCRSNDAKVNWNFFKYVQIMQLEYYGRTEMVECKERKNLVIFIGEVDYEGNWKLPLSLTKFSLIRSKNQKIFFEDR